MSKLQLQVGKFYATRDGRKAGPLFRGGAHSLPSFYWQAAVSPHSGYSPAWYEGGTFDGSPEHAMDLIAEWEDANEVESELQRLVRVANEGSAAVKELAQKHSNDVEYRFRSWVDAEKWLHGHAGLDVPSLRIKPRAKPDPFAPFRVGPRHQGAGTIVNDAAWEVKADGADHIKVGCQRFAVADLQYDLQHLTQGEPSGVRLGIKATRNGLMHDSHASSISWADADKLLAACEAMIAAKGKR